MKRVLLSLCLLVIAVFAVACGDKNGSESENTPVFYTVTFVQEGQADEVITVEVGENLQTPEIKAIPPVGYFYEWERTDFSTLSEDCTVRLKAVPNV